MGYCAEFEEKQFEGPLNCQLLGNGASIFTPGQVLESVLGFDAALLVSDSFFWSLWGVHAAPPGATLSPSDWGRASLLIESSQLPPYLLNVFIQYKRPEWLHYPTAAEWSYWQSPYFRYELTPHQQSALEACSAAVGSDGVVVYASPAFVTTEDLFRHTINRSLIANTNFVHVKMLHSHYRYTYVNAGTGGKAFSEPADIPPYSLLTSINESDSRLPRREAISVARKAVDAAMETNILNNETRSLFNNLIVRANERLVTRLRRGEVKAPENTLKVSDDYFRVQTYCWLTNTNWLLGGKAGNRRAHRFSAER